MKLPNSASSTRSRAPCCDRSSATEILQARTAKNHHDFRTLQTQAPDARQPPGRGKRESDLQFPEARNPRSTQHRANLCPPSPPAVAATADRRATVRPSAAPPTKRVLRNSRMTHNRSQVSCRKRRWNELSPTPDRYACLA